jgi:hypothetical protein
MTKIEKEITPLPLRCSLGGCPAVFVATDGDIVVIGKKLQTDLQDELAGRIADDEFAVKLSRDFFKGLSE